MGGCPLTRSGEWSAAHRVINERMHSRGVWLFFMRVRCLREVLHEERDRTPWPLVHA
jgi:hypothetical protein